MTALTAMAVSNASLYDGASGLAEAVLMAVRGNRKSKSRKVLMPTTVHPNYRKATRAIVEGQNIELVELAYDRHTGTTSLSALQAFDGEDITAVVIQQPNFFGVLEDVAAITDWAHAHAILVISVCNPLTLAVLTPPGEWGETGVDIACGDGQPLGAPLSSGGPYYGYICCTDALMRQMPGRIVGRTVDLDGKQGFVLTLQAREQHIRRSKATSNICTNQGLVVTASTIHMAIMGPQGLENTAAACHANTLSLLDALCRIDGVARAHNSAVFHEAVLTLAAPASVVLPALLDRGILGGYDLSMDYPELGNAIVVCATEMRSAEDIRAYATALAEVMAAVSRKAKLAGAV